MLSRSLALPATHEIATTVAALLSDLGGGAPKMLVHKDAPTPEVASLPTSEAASPPAPEVTSAPTPGATDPDTASVVTSEVAGRPAPNVPHALAPNVPDALAPDALDALAPQVSDAPASDLPARPRILGPTGLGAASLLITPPVGTTGPTVPPVISSTASAPPRVTTTTRTIAEQPTPPTSPANLPGATMSPGPTAAPWIGEPLAPPTGHIPTGPTGLGTASTRRSAGGSAIPPLYCPPPMRDDPALAAIVNERILAWAKAIGLYEGRLDDLRDAGFGRLIMLAHPDCNDPDRLLAAAKCAVAEWAVDDYYCDAGADDTAPDGTPSSAEAELGPRLELAAAAIDPVHLPARYVARLEEVMQADPILRAFRSAFAHVAEYATPAQLARLRTEIAGWFIALGAEAGWRLADRTPPAWEYLTNRQPHSFLPCMAPIDVVGGYELQAAEYTDPRVRRVITTAALASQLVNDLYSMAREDRSDGREFNLPTVLVAEEGCTRREAVVRTAELHDELMHRLELEAAPLAALGSAELRRYLTGVWAWLGGSRAWHADSRRYSD
ncbi:family 2 encapsulin nanocompartment cargo protein terpene cyclase [Nocardia sp. NPDC050175]|uniref:family 2 encapsulin nanocompartment cargo protein terpene cyclase n=1 Tax=Nocardia sp. NPDC050175 TaxID=3364317 RepID=UPI00379C16D4